MIVQVQKLPEKIRQILPNKQSDSSLQQSTGTYLNTLTPKLEQILSCLITQINQLQIKYAEEERKYIKQIQEKDKLILSLTKINNTLMKENTRMKKKSQAQFQYFVKRIAETQCNALNDKKNLEEAIILCQDVIKKLTGSEEKNKMEFQSKISSEQVKNRLNQVKDLNFQLMNLPSTPRSPKKLTQKLSLRNNQINTEIQPAPPSQISQQNSPLLYRPSNTNKYQKLTNSACIYPNPEKEELRFNRQKNQLVIQI